MTDPMGEFRKLLNEMEAMLRSASDTIGNGAGLAEFSDEDDYEREIGVAV